MEFQIPDKRSTKPEDYDKLNRRGRMKQSWTDGVEEQNNPTITLEDGLTWGSIGKLFGYLFGSEDESFQEELWEKMLTQFKRTERGNPLN
jgi:hypothetical protein